MRQIERLRSPFRPSNDRTPLQFDDEGHAVTGSAGDSFGLQELGNVAGKIAPFAGALLGPEVGTALSVGSRLIATFDPPSEGPRQRPLTKAQQQALDLRYAMAQDKLAAGRQARPGRAGGWREARARALAKQRLRGHSPPKPQGRGDLVLTSPAPRRTSAPLLGSQPAPSGIRAPTLAVPGAPQTPRKR